jgi:tRNA threonylcarbamoyladenosine biosynthesis protein TsaE
MKGGSILPRTSLEIMSRNPAETQALGHVIGELAQAGDIVLLSGELGAGKTCLVQGIARGLGIKGTTPSPSFVLVREFQGRIPLYHADLYRLELKEIASLGLDEYLYGHGLCAVEWAEKGVGLLPADHLDIRMDYLGEEARRICLTAQGERYQKLLTKLKKSNILRKNR